jgi:hypothetical protein
MASNSQESREAMALVNKFMTKHHSGDLPVLTRTERKDITGTRQASGKHCLAVQYAALLLFKCGELE